MSKDEGGESEDGRGGDLYERVTKRATKNLGTFHILGYNFWPYLLWNKASTVLKVSTTISDLRQRLLKLATCHPQAIDRHLKSQGVLTGHCCVSGADRLLDQMRNLFTFNIKTQ